ncbi:MAG: gamma-glutamyltransferase [Sphingobium sp.]|nr:gamma-glutamyltransferase [Sphingobium sp.]
MIRPLLLSLALLLAPAAQPALAKGKASATPKAIQSAGAISAPDPRAAAAGVEILKAGGNATDAAIATMLALNVVEPQNSGLGGGSFMIAHDGKTGKLTSYDGRETAPAAATPNWFLDAQGRPIPFQQMGRGGRSAGVPGNLRMIAFAHKAGGKLPWARLFAPAIKLARDGFLVSPRLHNGLSLYGRNMATDARPLYYDASGNALPIGSTFKNPELAALLERVAREGPDSFYVGPLAQKIVTALNTAEASQSAMTTGDLAGYQAKERAPVCGAYRKYRICSMGPPSSGGLTVLMILAQLERFDMKALGRSSPVAWHLFAESQRLAYADRDLYIGDPDFVSVPVAGLLDPAYLAQRSALISEGSTLAIVEPGKPAGAPERTRVAFKDDPGTSDLAVADAHGNVVQVTTTINGYFGSGVQVEGMFLNNEMPDFDAVPVKDGFYVANRVEGGKRPRSSMAPTIVYGPDGKVRLAIGAAGGATIIGQVSKAIIGVVDWGLSAQDAIAMGLLYSPGKGGTLEQGTELEALQPGLQALGEQLRIAPLGLKANAVEFVGGKWAGAADPRSEGVGMTTTGAVTTIKRRSNDLNGAHE